MDALHEFVVALGGPFFEEGGSPVLPLRCPLVDGTAWQAWPADGSRRSSAPIVGWSSAWARPMFAFFLLRQTSLKYIPFVEGALRMHFQKSTSTLCVCKRRARPIRFFVLVVGFTWSSRLPCLRREGRKFGFESVCVMLATFFVLHATARILVIRVPIRNSPFLICSAHARCASGSARRGSLDGMVEELGDVVVQHRRDGEPFLLCIDSNARVGSVVSSFVGGQELGEDSKNDEFFHAFLARTGTALPATFRGGGGTWRGEMASFGLRGGLRSFRITDR